MLVTFSTPAHGDVTMFGDVAIQLLKMMGRSNTIPSALYAEGVPAALQGLKTAVEQGRSNTAPNSPAKGEEEDVAVSMSNRALPLIELLEAAVRENSTVMWDSNA